MNKNHYKQANFLTSAQTISQLPDDNGCEVAFAGRSNAGKSSVINILTEQKSLARTSKTPGRTQLINFFPLDDERRIVDLPGYGYAKVPDGVKNRWARVLTEYVESRTSLTGIVLITDVRRGLTEQDVQMLEWLHHVGKTVHILMNKADKLSKNKAKQTLLETASDIENSGFTVQLFSALKRTGLEELKDKLDQWYQW
jgi:GTP-binding protein